MQFSDAQKTRATVRGWPPELIQRAEASPARPDQIDNILNVQIAPERVNKWLDFVENNPEHPFAGRSW